MSGGFFRGTSADQDTRFSNKQAKLLKTHKFPPELDQLVDMSKVQIDIIKPWIATRVTELLGFEDEVLINFIYGLLEGKNVDGKQIQIQITGFMEKNTSKFMKELWVLLNSAQNNASGVPQQFLDAKEEEIKKKKEESDRIMEEIQKKREKEKIEEELEMKAKRDDNKLTTRINNGQEEIRDNKEKDKVRVASSPRRSREEGRSPSRHRRRRRSPSPFRRSRRRRISPSPPPPRRSRRRTPSPPSPPPRRIRSPAHRTATQDDEYRNKDRRSSPPPPLRTDRKVISSTITRPHESSISPPQRKRSASPYGSRSVMRDRKKRHSPSPPIPARYKRHDSSDESPVEEEPAPRARKEKRSIEENSDTRGRHSAQKRETYIAKKHDRGPSESPDDRDNYNYAPKRKTNESFSPDEDDYVPKMKSKQEIKEPMKPKHYEIEEPEYAPGSLKKHKPKPTNDASSDSEYESNRGKRKHKKYSDESSESESESEEESRRREKRKRREKKYKSRNEDFSEEEDDKKRIEVELREKALQSLRARKGSNP